MSKHTSIAVDDVKQLVTTGSMETRAYFVAVDHSTRSVVLSIRGTFSISDTMVDLICNPVGMWRGCGILGHSNGGYLTGRGCENIVQLSRCVSCAGVNNGYNVQAIIYSGVSFLYS